MAVRETFQQKVSVEVFEVKKLKSNLGEQRAIFEDMDNGMENMQIGFFFDEITSGQFLRIFSKLSGKIS